MSHGTISLVKGREKAIYLEFVVIRQVMAVADADPSNDLETRVFKDDKVFLYVPVYNKAQHDCMVGLTIT